MAATIKNCLLLALLSLVTVGNALLAQRESFPNEPAENSFFQDFNADLFYVQFGAFARVENAETQKIRILKKNDKYPVRIKMVFKDDQQLFKVQVKGFSSIQEAQEYLIEMDIEGFIGREETYTKR